MYNVFKLFEHLVKTLVWPNTAKQVFTFLKYLKIYNQKAFKKLTIKLTLASFTNYLHYNNFL